MSDDENIVILKDVKKDYVNKGRKEVVAALRGLSMQIKRGSMVAIKGPSGSGKTTLLQIIGALDLPTSGMVDVNGKDISKMNEQDLTEYRAKTIGFVFQTFNLIPNLTALENVELPMEALNVPKEKRRKRAIRLLTAVGMAKRVDYRPSRLSGGEAQRTAIARALANKPSIILADEPTGNLDSGTGATIISLLEKLNTERGTTVIIVTHSDNIAKMCSRTYTIKDGRISSEVDTKKEAEIVKMKIKFSASDKIMNKLITAGYDSVEAIGKASIEELTQVLGDANKAKRIAKKAALLKELDEEKVE